MNQKTSLFALRVVLGFMYFYAGITKVLASNWSAAGYLNSAKNFPGLFHWFTQPGILPVVNFMNEWGLTLLGVSLILGIFIRYSAPLGVLLMVLYYLVLPFPHQNANAFLIDDHIIYIAALLVLFFYRAETYMGLEKMFTSMFGKKR